MMIDKFEWLNTLTRWKTIDDIPDFPRFDKDDYIDVVIPKIVELGGIPKSKLIDGQTYLGSCRNASEAIWRQSLNEFEYKRFKWGYTYIDTISHFEDEYYYDMFIPLKEKVN